MNTVAELRDLMSSYDYQQTELEKAAAGAANVWIGNNADEYRKWKADYDMWNSTYQPVRTMANTKLAGTMTSFQSLTDATVEYQALAGAFKPMVDLDGRMRASHVGNAAPKYENNPQPQAFDVGIAAFKATDAATRAMPDAVKGAIGNLTPGLAPKNADAAKYKSLTTTQKVLIGVGAFFGLALFVKVAK